MCPAYRASELEFYFTDLRARAVVVSDSLDTPARDVAVALGIDVLEARVDSTAAAGLFSLGEVSGVDRGAPPAPAPTAEALVLHTSGTTARPKIVPLSHRHLMASARNVASLWLVLRRARERRLARHTNDLTLVAIARGVDVGVDVERLDRQVTEWVLWGQVLTAGETARLPDDRWARNVALLRSWVRREAMLKAAGVGLALEPRTIELGSGGEIIALPPVLGAVGRWGLVDLEVPGCVAAVAVRSESALASVAVQLGEGRSLDLCPLVAVGA